MTKLYSYVLLAVLLFAGISCSESDTQKLHFEEQGREVPEFNADSAYSFVKKQVDFGPRNPNSQGHKQTKAFLLDTFRRYAGERYVFAQEFSAEGYEEDILELSNIIAAFNPQSTDRIFLSAHWDTRPRADKDKSQTEKPILGADDGASGVGVLLELARIFQKHPPPVGVDIVLFDGEDYGREGDLSKYFLGSRYWSENPPVAGYAPRFGILLDMVGAHSAQFPKEGYSMQYAPRLVNEVWDIAADKGYQDLFINKRGKSIADDHLVVNRVLKIPTIDIIHYNTGNSNSQFAPYWHTHDDNLSVISKETLNGVGETLVELIYNRVEISN